MARVYNIRIWLGRVSNTRMPCTNTLCKVDATFPCTVVYSQMKFTPGDLAKKVLMVKDLVKDAQFKPVSL